MPLPPRLIPRFPVTRHRCPVPGPVGVPAEPSGIGRDRGANPVELAILLPLIFLLLIASIQAGTYFLARAVALNAAQVAVTSARTLDGDSTATAEQKALDFIAATAGWLTPAGDADMAVVVKDEAAGEVTATVTGKALQLVPGLDLTVQQTARGPIERFIPEE